MTNEQIQADIARGLELTRQIAVLKDELKAIEARLESAGLRGPHVPLEDAEREGKQAILTSPTHKLAVRLESDVLVGGFEINSILAAQVQALISEKAFKSLFKAVHKYERKESDGHKFRKKAKAAIGDQDKYLQLITALRSKDKDGIPKSKTVIAWDSITTVEPVSEKEKALPMIPPGIFGQRCHRGRRVILTIKIKSNQAILRTLVRCSCKLTSFFRSIGLNGSCFLAKA